ncbi:cell division protein FtsK [Pseudonocardia sp. C8]|uniref:FtsK/SpoIIIE domain-containing protein n=1 Tax=Pseudonocardia sp. C8 TaxID=2762759 RepID=UPI00164239EA|nr:FtsK/SpoIIIE domain-containing protein [Pseudonocardia sp. C8]MBC3191469.1 cell division protein FtsK [Pseudonocardia sp. C8]
MNVGTMIVLGGGLALGCWMLAKIAHAVTKALETLAAIAAVFVALWLAIKGAYLGVRWLVRHPRTVGTSAAVIAWWHWLGWLSLAVTIAAIVAGFGVWRWVSVSSFDVWAGRRIRARWQRWTIYAPRMPRWLRACRLTVSDDRHALVVNVNPLGRSGAVSRRRPRRDQTPRILGVRSGPSWDEVRVRLVPGQTPEDVDEAARALAVARGVARCQVRELESNVVSIDFQRRNLLSDVVACLDVAELHQATGDEVDLSRVWSGRTEYGTDWHQPLAGGHTLCAGATGAGKNSVMWAPIVSIGPAIRDGLVRVSGIDPKGMELAYGRDVFHRYAVTSKDALELLDELVDGMEARKGEHAGSVRTVPITRENPLELLEFDEIGALVRYVRDRKTREAITERVALLTTQGRALGYTMRGYVQEPTKDTVPVRELFPRRICLRVATKSHVGMVLGEHAYDRGAWANRIGESEAGVGYLFGEGIREPLRVRAAWVPDDAIKDLERLVTGPAPLAIPGPRPVLPFPQPAASPAGGAA